jgi:hypothetical protein
MVKEALPANIRCGAEVGPLMQSCMNGVHVRPRARHAASPRALLPTLARWRARTSSAEFLQMLTSQANEKASAANKNTISEHHLFAALDELGFGNLKERLGAAAEPPAKRAKGKRIAKRGAPEGMTPEELLRMQQELFASARQHVQAGAEPAPAPLPQT